MMCYLPGFDCPVAPGCNCLSTHANGTLISPSAVLIARHSGPIDYGCGVQNPDPCQFTARFRRKPNGTLANPNDCSTYHDVKITQFISLGNCELTDIAIAVLEQPVTHIQPIPVDPSLQLAPNMPVIIGGWGSTNPCAQPATLSGKLFLKNITISSLICGGFEWPMGSSSMFDSGGAVLLDTPNGLRAAGIITSCAGGWDAHVIFGVPGPPAPCCPFSNPPMPCGDFNLDGTVDLGDMLMIINNWGACADCRSCPLDRTFDCSVGVAELLDVTLSWGQSCGLQCLGDINQDGQVDVMDLQVVFGSWGLCQCLNCPADINGDGLINITDLQAVLNDWGDCAP